MTTDETLTDAQILALAREAATAGDYETARDCAIALDPEPAYDEHFGPAEVAAARARIVAVIRNAEAMQDPPAEDSRMGGGAPRFKLGRLLQTSGVQAAIPADVLAVAVRRHASGDFGNLCEEDRAANESALRYGTRILSSYAHGHVEFWLITEADRSVTTALLPSEY
jgi:hypothetical protein